MFPLNDTFAFDILIDLAFDHFMLATAGRVASKTDVNLARARTCIAGLSLLDARDCRTQNRTMLNVSELNVSELNVSELNVSERITDCGSACAICHVPCGTCDRPVRSLHGVAMGL